MVGLSFREYLEIQYDLEFSTISIADLTKKHETLAHQIIQSLEEKGIKIIKCFSEYLQKGYYPYFKEIELLEEFLAASHKFGVNGCAAQPMSTAFCEECMAARPFTTRKTRLTAGCSAQALPRTYEKLPFMLTLEQNLHTTLESDLVAIYPHLNGNSINKMKQLVTYLAQAVPFTPNWKKIKTVIDITDDRTLKTYFNYLKDARIIRILESGGQKFQRLEKPEKIFLGNPNQMFAYATSHPDKGTMRETFFLSMLEPFYQVKLAPTCDFLVDEKYHFEVGGKNKNIKQIRDHHEGYLALDGIEAGVKQRIPLWLFGFLY